MNDAILRAVREFNRIARETAPPDDDATRPWIGAKVLVRSWWRPTPPQETNDAMAFVRHLRNGMDAPGDER
jgi:hypothetical protein